MKTLRRLLIAATLLIPVVALAAPAFEDACCPDAPCCPGCPSCPSSAHGR